AGFRHGHIISFYETARGDERVQVVGACEEDAATAEALRAAGKVVLSHHTLEQILHDVECDVIAVGDYFARRGQLILRALRAGKHVISDKPICTSLAELDQIEAVANEKKLVVAALLDLRDRGNFRTMRKLIREVRAIGEVHTVNVTAQHPLMLGKRPGWYF